MKRGATILNFVLIIGMLLVSMIVLLNLQKIALFQSKQVELDVSADFVKDIRSIIENAEAYPTDLRATITLHSAREYDMQISNGQIFVYFPREEITILEPFTTSNLNILPSRFSNSGKIYIYGEARNLLITNKLTCNLTDTKCDAGCIFREFNNQCDPACYSPYISDLCNPICIDINKDDITNKDDADTICDIDCYNNYKNGGYYDVDCIATNDKICDPDTNNIIDGICDGDCKPRNGICDPDCGTEDLDC